MRKQTGIVFGQAEFARIALLFRARQFRHCLFHLGNPLRRNRQRQQIGVRKIAIVHRIFLRTHRPRFIAIRIIEPGFLHDPAAILDQFNLTAHFIADRLVHEVEGVEVLDFATRAEWLTAATHRDVGITAEGPLLHIAVANTNPAHQCMQRFGIRNRLLRAGQIGFSDNFQQRCTGTIQIDTAHTMEIFMQRFTGVFFQMRAGQMHRFFNIAHHDRQRATLHHRQFVLADLVALRQIRIEIILARKNRPRTDGSADRKTKTNGTLNGPAIQYRQHAGQRDINRTGLRIRTRAEGGRRAGKYFRAGRQLRVGFKPDHNFPSHCATLREGWAAPPK